MTKKKEEVSKPKLGRPKFPYTDDLAKEICRGIATSSESVKSLCKKNKHWPNHQIIFDWIGQRKEFSDQYACAKRQQAEFLVDELLDTARSSHDSESASCNRLIVDTSKWIACKMIPKVYGDQKQIEELKVQNDEMMKELLTLRAELAAKNKKDY